MRSVIPPDIEPVGKRLPISPEKELFFKKSFSSIIPAEELSGVSSEGIGKVPESPFDSSFNAREERLAAEAPERNPSGTDESRLRLMSMVRVTTEPIDLSVSAGSAPVSWFWARLMVRVRRVGQFSQEMSVDGRPAKALDEKSSVMEVKALLADGAKRSGRVPDSQLLERLMLKLEIAVLAVLKKVAETSPLKAFSERSRDIMEAPMADGISPAKLDCWIVKDMRAVCWPKKLDHVGRYPDTPGKRDGIGMPASFGSTKMQRVHEKVWKSRFENRSNGSGCVELPTMITLDIVIELIALGSEKKQSGRR